MISWPIQAAVRSGTFERVHVSTDSSEIADVSKAYGATVEFYRDESLCGDDVPLKDVLSWVLTEFESQGERFNSACLIYATAAFITPEDLIEAKDLLISQGANYPVLSVVAFPAPIEWALVRKSEDLVSPMHAELTKLGSQTFGRAWYDAAMLLWFGTGAGSLERDDFPFPSIPYEVPRSRGIDIDTIEDLDFARSLAGQLRTD